MDELEFFDYVSSIFFESTKGIADSRVPLNSTNYDSFCLMFWTVAGVLWILQNVELPIPRFCGRLRVG